MTPPNDSARQDAEVVRAFDNLRDELGRLQTLVLDALERLAILETSQKFTDAQRVELLGSVTRLSQQIGEVTIGIRDVVTIRADLSSIRSEASALRARLDGHDLVLAETRGGIRATRIVWGIIWAVFGAAIAILGTIVKIKSG